MSGCTILETNN